MSDEEHQFESKADAGASKTYPQQACTIRKGCYIVIKGRACKVYAFPVSEKLLPAYNAVSNATYAITSEISILTVETLGSTDKTSNSSSGKVEDRYKIVKLEPGEDEKALSQFIKDAISPKGSEQVGMVEKMKESVTSYLQQSSNSVIKAAESSRETKVSTYSSRNENVGGKKGSLTNE
ncbi:hypothetical protein POM88_013363 [Heracleum sosnowskyi]|uniref:Translation initiation factor 5A-like N-terminal domain-containing protein n=1 Tax=Heracleum sosnowskyi TaxID=360622 RepID=A0AAD8N399_9APIA|nr:hypothetical protein POM88_013363 [Heracleum sosnowskyi]